MNTYPYILLTLLSVFVLTVAKIFDDEYGTKLVVVAGVSNGLELDYPGSEVIDLDLGLDCKGWTDFPIEVYASTGALFNIESAKGTEGTF